MTTSTEFQINNKRIFQYIITWDICILKQCFGIFLKFRFALDILYFIWQSELWCFWKKGQRSRSPAEMTELSSGQQGRLMITSLTMLFSSRDKSLFRTTLGHFEGAWSLGPRRYHIKLVFTHPLKLPRNLKTNLPSNSHSSAHRWVLSSTAPLGMRL